MSVKFTNTTHTADYLKNTSMPTTSELSTTFYRHLNSTGGSVNNTRMYSYLNNAGSSYIQMMQVTSAVYFNGSASGSTGVKSSSPTTLANWADNVWFDFALVSNGNTTGQAVCYVKRTIDTSWAITLTLDSMTAEAGSFGWMLGEYGGALNEYRNFCHFRAWNAALSSAELLSEAASATIVRSSNVVLNTPFTDGALTSLTGNTWTANGTLTTAAGATDPTFATSNAKRLLMLGVG